MSLNQVIRVNGKITLPISGIKVVHNNDKSTSFCNIFDETTVKNDTYKIGVTPSECI